MRAWVLGRSASRASCRVVGAVGGFEGVEEIPGGDFAGAKVEGGTEVSPACGRLDVGHIRHPNLLGPGGQRCFLQEMGGDGLPVAANNGFGAITAFLQGFELAPGHEFDDTASAVAASLGTQFTQDTSCAVVLAAGVELGFRSALRELHRAGDGGDRAWRDGRSNRSG